MKVVQWMVTFALALSSLVMSQVEDTMGGVTDGTPAYGTGWWWFWFVLLLVVVGLAIWWVTSTGGRRPTPGGGGQGAPGKG